MIEKPSSAITGPTNTGPPPATPRTPPKTEPRSPPKAALPMGEINIEADAAPDDIDDGYGTEGMSQASTSLSSSVRDYAFEHNRRFHKFHEGQYIFPNDEPEQEREDMKHVMILSLCEGKLHFAPLDKPQRILDVGTGTGIWAIDMGDEYPEAEVLGIDLSPIQPSWIPPNVRFMVDDAEADWVHPPNSFDYIHLRHMVSSIRDWPNFLSQAYKSLKPGGWIELQEMRFVLKCDDGTVREDNQVIAFLENIKKGLVPFNVDLLAMEKNQEKLNSAGFVNVEEIKFKVPLGVWPKNPKMKQIGNYNRSSFYDGAFGVSIKPLTRGLNWTVEQVEMFLVEVRKELMNTASGQHGYIPFHVVTGQKPV